MNGWVKLHRCLLEKVIWEKAKPEQKCVFITIFLLANHEEKQWLWKGQRFLVKPGQFITRSYWKHGIEDMRALFHSIALEVRDG